jgi:hypothetical protein
MQLKINKVNIKNIKIQLCNIMKIINSTLYTLHKSCSLAKKYIPKCVKTNIFLLPNYFIAFSCLQLIFSDL